MLPLTATDTPNWSPSATSLASSLSICDQLPAPLSRKTYAEPRLSSNSAPTTATPPLMETEAPKLSPIAASAACSFCCCDQVPVPGLRKMYAEPARLAVSSSPHAPTMAAQSSYHGDAARVIVLCRVVGFDFLKLNQGRRGDSNSPTDSAAAMGRAHADPDKNFTRITSRPTQARPRAHNIASDFNLNDTPNGVKFFVDNDKFSREKQHEVRGGRKWLATKACNTTWGRHSCLPKEASKSACPTLLLVTAVETDFDEEIVAEEIAAEQKRIRIFCRSSSVTPTRFSTSAQRRLSRAL